jgi:hypothetical protein
MTAEKACELPMCHGALQSGPCTIPYVPTADHDYDELNCARLILSHAAEFMAFCGFIPGVGAELKTAI